MGKGIKSLKWLYPALFLLFVAWTAVGAFPLVNYEGDSNAVLGNITTTLAGGEFAPDHYYAYDDQPLTYWLIAAVDRITPLGPEESYCLICWLAMVWLAWVPVRIVHRLTGLSRCVILLACIIFSQFASSPPVVTEGLAPATVVWNYIGELVFNMLVLVGSIKMSDRIIRELMGLG